MKDRLIVGIFQMDIIWESIHSNQQKIEELLTGLEHVPDILVLPEMYATGFTMNPRNLDVRSVESQLEWQKQVSEKFKLAIVGSTVIADGTGFKNRLIFTADNSAPSFYDKRHLFKMEKENQSFTCGTDRQVIEYSGIKIMPQICYDLRFPVWSRNDTGYHLLIYVANWPASRRVVWDTLLRARAIENQCYCIGVNRVGADENPIDYDGGSAVYGPKGEEYLQMTDKDTYAEVELSINELINFREKFGAYKDADEFEIKNRELPPPGYLYR